MVPTWVIDGNNLLHALHKHAPVPDVGRESLVRRIDRWSRASRCRAVLVFDGPAPREGLARQMSSTSVDVRFSAPATADDLIVEMIEKSNPKAGLTVVSDDTAIRYAASYRKCRLSDTRSFIRELFDSSEVKQTAPAKSIRKSSGAESDDPQGDRDEKPTEVSPEDRREWLDRLKGNMH